MDTGEIESNREPEITNILTKKRNSAAEDVPVKLAKTKIKKLGTSKIVNGKLMTNHS